MSPRTKFSLFALLTIVGLALLAVSFGWFDNFREDDSGSKRIMIASVVEIDPIKELRDGFRERIAQSPHSMSVTYVERNAQGDPGLMAQIAGEVARDKPDIVYVLGTPLAQAIQKRAPDVTIVQGAVTDPVEAGLAANWNGSGRRYAANSDRPSSSAIVALVRRLTPSVRTLGFLYNPSEPNSVAVLDDLRIAAAESGIQVREFSVSRAADLPITVNTAAASVDAIFIPPDNTVTAGLRAIIQTASVANVPVYATTPDAVSAGALAGVTNNFFTLGSEAAEITLSILFDGQNPATIPIALPKNPQTFVNPETASRLGISVPEDISTLSEGE